MLLFVNTQYIHLGLWMDRDKFLFGTFFGWTLPVFLHNTYIVYIKSVVYFDCVYCMPGEERHSPAETLRWKFAYCHSESQLIVYWFAKILYSIVNKGCYWQLYSRYTTNYNHSSTDSPSSIWVETGSHMFPLSLVSSLSSLHSFSVATNFNSCPKNWHNSQICNLSVSMTTSYKLCPRASWS